MKPMNQPQEKTKHIQAGDTQPLHQGSPEESTLTTPDFVNIEANLAALGFFTPSIKERITKRKSVRITRWVKGKKEEKRVTFVPMDLGLPTAPADQDKYVAMMKIMNDSRTEKGLVTNPITFTTAELLKLLGQSDAGKNYRDVRDWLQRMTGTLIISEKAVYFSGKDGRKEWRSANFHVFESTVSKGQELTDGTTAEKHHVFLSDWQLNNIQRNNTLPLDWETYRRLKNHIAKGLIFPLEIMLYATQGQGRLEKRYDDLCQFLHIRQYRYPSQIKQTLGPSLDELQQHGYIKRWEVTKTADGKAYKVVFWHGHKFYRDQRSLKGEPLDPVEQGRGASERELPNPSGIENKPDQIIFKPEASQQEIEPQILARLMKWGIAETRARELVESLPTSQRIDEQLEYAEHEINRQGSGIPNPAGFIISRLKENAPVPENFISSHKKQEIEEQSQRRRESQAALERAYEDYLSDLVSQHIRAHYSEEEYRAYQAAKKQTLAQHIPNHTEEMLSAMAEASIRQEFLQKISDRIPFDQFCEEKKRSAIAEK